jgi:hypothetical protein
MEFVSQIELPHVGILGFLNAHRVPLAAGFAFAIPRSETEYLRWGGRRPT